MSTDKLQSAIREARDQLFLDTADGVRLNVVTSNLGLDRPLVGLDDDEWRAVAKAVGLQPKQIRNAFFKVLEVCVGPQKTRISNISSDAAVGDRIITMEDASDLLQIGTLVFSPGQPDEETVNFCFRDLVTNEVFLVSDLLGDHAAVDAASSRLAATTLTGAATLTVIDSSQFPTTGYPYSIIVDRGLETEETLAITNNDIGTNTLTLLNVTTQDHLGAKSTFVRKALARANKDGDDFVRLDVNDTRVFPATGWIRLNFGAGNEEVQEYTENTIGNSVLKLKRVLANAHAVGESVELVTPGALVETCSVVQTGQNWELYETEPRKIKVFIPGTEEGLRLLDAAYLHDATPAAAASTLAVATVATDTVIQLASTAGFPEAGIVVINGSTSITFVDNDTTTNQLTLVRPVGVVHNIGDSAALVTVPYAGTDLDEGNLRDVLGALLENRFPGPYVYDQSQRAPGFITTSTLGENLAGPTRLAASQLAGRTNLDVEDANLYPAPPFTPFAVRIGRGSGAEETRTSVDRTLQGDASTTLNAAFAPGISTITVADSTDFPESNGLDPAGYQIIIDRGGANEEIVRVNQNTTGAPGTFTLEANTVSGHLLGETVELVNDVLTFDVLSNDHDGPLLNPSVEGELVEKTVPTVDLNTGDGAFFPNAGVFYINFGNERLSARARITAVPGGSLLDFADTSVFPTTDFPYIIKVGEGKSNEEFAFVTGNNTGLNRLTLSAALSGTFSPGDYVEFEAGTPIALTYTDRDGDTLELSDATTVLPSVYTQGERILLSPSLSVPSEDGNDYAFLLPPTAEVCLTVLFDLIRAAGIEVIFLEDK